MTHLSTDNFRVVGEFETCSVRNAYAKYAALLSVK